MCRSAYRKFATIFVMALIASTFACKARNHTVLQSTEDEDNGIAALTEVANAAIDLQHEVEGWAEADGLVLNMEAVNADIGMALNGDPGDGGSGKSQEEVVKELRKKLVEENQKLEAQKVEVAKKIAALDAALAKLKASNDTAAFDAAMIEVKKAEGELSAAGAATRAAKDPKKTAAIPPPSAAAGPCDADGVGKRIDGRCWYLSRIGQSCDKVCGEVECVFDAEGSRVDGPTCQKIANAIRHPSDRFKYVEVGDIKKAPNGLGCYLDYYNYFYLHRSNGPVSGSVGDTRVYRYCVCKS